ncbi:hypothetical protein ACHAWC_001769 [Mediolabrus comicus]
MMPTITIDPTKAKPTASESSPPSYFFAENTSFDLFSLACTSITLASGRFHRLFSSEADGLSCNRLMYALLGYRGPTLVVIRSKDISKKCASGLFGAYTGFPWDRESDWGLSQWASIAQKVKAERMNPILCSSIPKHAQKAMTS